MINFSHVKIAQEISDKIMIMKDFTEKQVKNMYRDYDLWYEFDLQKGSCVNRGPNTRFSFDSTIGSETYNYMKYKFSFEETDESKIEEEMFETHIVKELEDNHLQVIRDVISENIKLPQNILPLKHIEIKSFEIVDFSSIPALKQHNFIISKKNTGDSNSNKLDTVSISQVIADEVDKDENVTLDYIVSKHHSLDTICFRKVESIKKGFKYLWNTTISVYIDYSLVVDK
jgi:hypothetical protein